MPTIQNMGILLAVSKIFTMSSVIDELKVRCLPLTKKKNGFFFNNFKSITATDFWHPMK